MAFDPARLEERMEQEQPRPGDWRTGYARDKARIIHGAAFRRLQGKTQVMGAGEGDFHRTRLTHSLEVAQIGLGLFDGLTHRQDMDISADLAPFLAGGRDLVASSCYAHDLGHPPFGHGGERALHRMMTGDGGFEGNAQTIRLLVKLEKYRPGKGINPTRRTLLSVLKYPVNFADYPGEAQKKPAPPKCYYGLERRHVEWALSAFPRHDQEEFTRLHDSGKKKKPRHMTFDASIMECADDIAYCTHDLEDIVARRLVGRVQLLDAIDQFFKDHGKVSVPGNELVFADFERLFKDSCERKAVIGKIVNLLMTGTKVVPLDQFEHPLMRYRMVIDDSLKSLVKFLKIDLTYDMVVNKPEVQMLERKGQRLISRLYEEYQNAPHKLIPHYHEMDENDSTQRRICDYIAGMTDAYAEKIYHRMFTPGVGSSRDEL